MTIQCSKIVSASYPDRRSAHEPQASASLVVSSPPLLLPPLLLFKPTAAPVRLNEVSPVPVKDKDSANIVVEPYALLDVQNRGVAKIALDRWLYRRWRSNPRPE
jgi:hypothetical protein